MTLRHATHRNRFAAVLLGTTFALAVPAPTAAQTAGSDTDAWQFEITPYLFAAGLNGKTGVSTGLGDVTADVDMGFDDILDNLDSGFMALFEARKGLWSFAFEGVYFKL